MSRRKVAELDTPFSSVEWPAISQEDQDSILELLCSLLEPIGQHRRNHVVPSEGKRSRRKSKAAAAKTNGQEQTKEETDTADKAALPAPPPPELSRFVDVGLVSITRELADHTPAPPVPADDQQQHQQHQHQQKPPADKKPPYVAVFVARSGHPSAFYSHLPQMIAASPARPLLVGFSKPCEDRLSAALGIPRVSSIALRAGAPQSHGLMSFLHEKVAPIRVAWLDEAVSGQFRDTQIHMADVKVGPKRKKK